MRALVDNTGGEELAKKVINGWPLIEARTIMLTVQAVGMRETVVVAEASGHVAGLGLDQPQVARPVLHERNQEEPSSSLTVKM